MKNKNYMNKLRMALMIGLFTMLNVAANAQVYTVGTGGNYTSLYAAFDDINNGGITGDITLQITSNLSEPNTCQLDYSGFGGSYSKVLIYPTSPNLTITGNSSGATIIKFFGADNVTIDGRINASGTTQDLSFISPHSGTSSNPIITFANESTLNKIQYCKFKSNASNIRPILFESATTVIGNSNNTIRNNRFEGGVSAQTTLITLNAIYSESSVNFNNSSDSIINNHIVNFKESGISLNFGSSGWYISGNSLYDETTDLSLGVRQFVGITKSDENTNSTLTTYIINNYIGGSAPLCGGTPMTLDYGLKRFTGIRNSGFGSPHVVISNNTIQNIRIINTSLLQAFIGIESVYGKSTITNNTIGSQSIANSIYVNASSMNVNGIIATSNDSSFVNNNTIGGFHLAALNAFGANANMSCIYQASINTYSETKNNICGSPTITNSISNTTASFVNSGIHGIVIDQPSIAKIENNQIINLNNNSEASSATLQGITVFNAGDGSIIKNNTITNLSSNSKLIGIQSLGTTGASGRSISKNIVQNLQCNNATVAKVIIGIDARLTSNGIHKIEQNFIQGLSTLSPVDTVFGMVVEKANSNSSTIINNIISINTNEGNVVGMNMLNNTNAKVLHNTVYLAGNPRDTRTSCIRFSGNLPSDISNNIFSNADANTAGIVTKNHFCVDNQSINLFPNINYNDYRIASTSSGGAIGYGASAAINYSNLAQWKTYTTQDLNSININPNFVNPGGNTPGAYFPLASVNGSTTLGVNQDYFGSTRAIDFWMGAIQSQSVLPLTWKSFTAIQQSDKTMLQWRTFEEINTSYFDVEKSKDASHWDVIARVSAAGNSRNENCYSAQDNEMTEGTTYYRIKQVDVDEKYSYSHVEKIMVTSETEVVFYPNPCQSQLHITMNEVPENGVVEIYSLDGKLLIKNSISNMNHTLSVESLTKGTYILHVSTNQKTYTTKFVRQ